MCKIIIHGNKRTEITNEFSFSIMCLFYFLFQVDYVNFGNGRSMEKEAWDEMMKYKNFLSL